MYFAAVHDPVEAANVVEVALTEVAAGAAWVKLVADFPPASALAVSANAPAEQTYSLDVMRELITAAHRAGARVAAHVTTAVVGDLVRLGVDSVEPDPRSLTGRDVVGSIPREIALLVDCGLDPADALRAATSTAMTFLGAEARAAPAAVVTFAADPRSDPAALTRPAAVVIGGVRVR
jgi:imidazolonepropionase-like amidohydrolase